LQTPVHNWFALGRKSLAGNHHPNPVPVRNRGTFLGDHHPNRVNHLLSSRIPCSGAIAIYGGFREG